MIRHLSKQDDDGDSTNDWIDSDDFLTTYITASWVTQLVSVSSIFPPSIHPYLFLSICGLRTVYLWWPPLVCHVSLVGTWCSLLVFTPMSAPVSAPCHVCAHSSCPLGPILPYGICVCFLSCDTCVYFTLSDSFDCIYSGLCGHCHV